jgi:hypothetical protein
MKRFPFLTGALLLALPAFGCGGRPVIARSDGASSDLPTNGGPDAAVTDGPDGSATPATAGNGGTTVSAGGTGGVNSIGGSPFGGSAGAAGVSGGGGGGIATATGGAGPGAAGAPPPAPVSLLAARNTAAGVGPSSIALGDLNHDGKLDLAIADSGGGVSILLGRGDSSFPSPANYDAGSKPTSVALGDLNGDGSPDLAVGNGGGGVSVLLNHGDGTFLGRVDYVVGSNVAAVAIGDLNGDGKLDLAIANAAGNGSGGLNVLMNRGDGTFAAPVSYRPGNDSMHLAIGDVNDDGDPDLVVADASGGVVVLLNDGNGTFVAQAAFETDSVATSVVVADFNGDGRTDIAYTGDSLNVLMNTGNSTFDLKEAYPYGDASSGPDEAVALGDLNGDQLPDLALVNGQSGIASVFVNQLAGRFVRHDYSAGSDPKFVALGDLNGDGRADLVVAGDGRSDFVTVLSSTSSGSYSSDAGYRSGLRSTAIAIADVNGDGTSDLVTASDNTLNVILNRGKSGLATIPVSYPVASSGYVAVGDLDGDGDLDLAAAGALNVDGQNPVGYASILLNKGNGTYDAPVNYTAGTYAFDVKIGDLNGDGKLDLVVADQDQGTDGSQAALEVTVFLNAGGGTFAAGVPYPVAATGTANLDLSIGLGDLNGDGRPDLVEALADGSVAGFGKVTILLNNGSGAFVESANGPTGIEVSRILVADLNGDGRADLAASESTTKTVAVLLNRGAGILDSPVRYSILGDGFDIAAGDLNGDGKIDLTVAGYEGNIAVLLNNGAGIFVSGGNYASRGGPASLTVGDLNGDGRAEIATTINGGGDGTVRVLWNTTP